MYEIATGVLPFRGEATATLFESILQKTPVAHDEVFSALIEARVQRCGGEVRLILEGDAGGEPARAVPSMIKAIARAHEWQKGTVEGKFSSGYSIAALTGLHER